MGDAFGNEGERYLQKGNEEATQIQPRNGEDQYVQHVEMVTTSTTEVALITETRNGEKDQCIQHEEIVAKNNAESGSVTEIKDGEKDHYVHDEEIETANIVKLESATEVKQLATTVSQSSEEYDTGIKGASFHQIKEAPQNSLLSPHSEIFAYIEHSIKLMSEQQKTQQDHQCQILQQLSDMQREFYAQQNNQQCYQLDLLLQRKEYKNSQLQLFEELLQQIKNLIQQQNNLISGQIQQQQQDFQAKLMKDLAKQTEEQVQVLLQTSNKRETHQTSNNEGPPCGKSSFAFPTEPPNAFSRVAMSSGYSQDQESFSQESFKKMKVQSIDMRGSEVFPCEEVGLVFCNEFYPLWNSQNPSNERRENMIWGPHLFWENATAEMILFDNGQHAVQRYEGFECVSDFLLKLTNQERLEFRPSIDNERFKCVNSKHGLVVVALTGIILREGRSFGIFEQRFGLIQCLETRKLKIQFTILKTKYFNHIENAITAPTLNYTPEQLENTVCEINHN